MHIKLVLKKPNQLFKKLKSLLLILIFLLLNITPSKPHDHVTLYGKDLPLENIFNIIQKQTGYTLLYDHSILQDAKTVTLDLKDAGITETMNISLQGQSLEFTIVEKTVIVTKKQKRNIAPRRRVKPKAKSSKLSTPSSNSPPDSSAPPAPPATP